MEIWFFIKKRNDNDKNNFFDEKQPKNDKNVYVNLKQYSLLWTRPTDPWFDI